MKFLQIQEQDKSNPVDSIAHTDKAFMENHKYYMLQPETSFLTAFCSTYTWAVNDKLQLTPTISQQWNLFEGSALLPGNDFAAH